MRILAITFFLTLAFSGVIAQEQETLFNTSDDSEYVVMPVNVSFFPGFSMGESVAKGKKVKNHISYNILAGSAAKLEGVEFGGIWNAYTEEVFGLQWAGIANTVAGTGKGGQWAGIANVVEGEFKGAQWAGIINKVDANAVCAQWAGIANIVAGTGEVAQWAGIANVVDGEFRGAQWAGIANVVRNLEWGVQFSGIANVAEKVARGVQIGVVNVSNENDGIPVGPISYVNEFGLRYDVFADESKFFSAGLRTGTERFHNILFAGAQVNDPFRWSIGWVFGGHINVGEATYLDIDVSTQHINEKDQWTDGLNMLNKFRVLGGWQASDSLSLYAGPTLNYFVSEISDGSDLASWSISEGKSGRHWKRWWPGFVIGIKVQ